MPVTFHLLYSKVPENMTFGGFAPYIILAHPSYWTEPRDETGVRQGYDSGRGFVDARDWVHAAVGSESKIS